MAVKIKESAKPKEVHVSRFDFASDHRSGTIGELLEELNVERPKKNGERITFDSLQGTLEFIKQVTGILIERDDALIPLSTLKTIKLLFIANDESKKHLFRLLKNPTLDGKSTMEFCTGTTVSRDKTASAIIASLLEKLALEIPVEKLTIFSNLLGQRERRTTAEKLLLHIERANDEVMRILIGRISGNDRGLANAYYKLSKQIDSIDYQSIPNSTTPANESVFGYLDTLALRHFILHHHKHLGETRVKHPIGSISLQANIFCQSYSKKHCVRISATDKHFSVNNAHKVTSNFPSEITSLIRAATGFDTENRWLKPNITRARAILTSYGYRCYDKADPNAPLLSIYDIVAALCSFKYQQEAGDEYPAFWRGQISQGEDPQRLFDKGLRKSDPHQHQGVFQIYYNRFSEYQAAFTDTTASYHAWKAFQLSRLAAYLRIIQVSNIIGMSTAAISLDFLCLEHAMNVALEYQSIGM